MKGIKLHLNSGCVSCIDISVIAFDTSRVHMHIGVVVPKGLAPKFCTFLSVPSNFLHNWTSRKKDWV